MKFVLTHALSPAGMAVLEESGAELYVATPLSRKPIWRSCKTRTVLSSG